VRRVLSCASACISWPTVVWPDMHQQIYEQRSQGTGMSASRACVIVLIRAPTHANWQNCQTSVTLC